MNGRTFLMRFLTEVAGRLSRAAKNSSSAITVVERINVAIVSKIPIAAT